MSTERPHRRLTVWLKSVELVREVYTMTSRFPVAERYGLVSQMRRAAVSIPSNIAEGAARRGRKEFLQFLYTARGSLSELDTQVEIAAQLGFLKPDAQNALQMRVDEVSRLLGGMIVALARTGS
jgi:four helix bundle protein